MHLWSGNSACILNVRWIRNGANGKYVEKEHLQVFWFEWITHLSFSFARKTSSAVLLFGTVLFPWTAWLYFEKGGFTSAFRLQKTSFAATNRLVTLGVPSRVILRRRGWVEAACHEIHSCRGNEMSLRTENQADDQLACALYLLCHVCLDSLFWYSHAPTT